MKKDETFIQRAVFLINVFFRILIPPLYSFERLEKYCRSYIRKNPRTYIGRWFLAGLYKDYQNNEAAKKEYLEMSNLDYMTYKDRINFAEILFRLQEYQNVIDTLMPIIDKCWRNKSCCWYLGISYLRKGDLQNAVVHLEKGIKTNSRRYEDYWSLGFCYDRLGNVEKAEEAYMKGLRVNPDSRELKENLALIYIKYGQRLLDTNLEQAEKNFKRALEINPDDQEAIKLIGNVQKIKDDISRINKLKNHIHKNVKK